MKSIRAKIITLLLCCVILSSVAVSCICVGQMSTSIKHSTQENMLLLCEKNARMLNNTFNSIEGSVETLAHYVTDNLPSTDLLHEVHSSAYADFIAKISQVVTNHASSLNSAAAVYIVFNPTLYAQDAGLFYIYEGGTPVARPVTDSIFLHPENIKELTSLYTW